MTQARARYGRRAKADRLLGRPREDQPADEVRTSRGEIHPDVAAERQADDDRAAAGRGLDDPRQLRRQAAAIENGRSARAP